MNEALDIPRVANLLLADQARAAMLWTLMDGTTRPAGELAFAANVSAQSASGHLAKLVVGGLLHTEAQGRHRLSASPAPSPPTWVSRAWPRSARRSVRASPHNRPSRAPCPASSCIADHHHAL